MAMAQNTIVVGVFETAEQARDAIDGLKRAGFGENEIGFVTRVGVADPQGDVPSTTATGAVGGGVVGGVLGAAAALLIPGLGPALAGGILAATLGGAALGAAAGGVIGALTGLGISEKDAQFYQKELEAGHTVVTVKSSIDHEAALSILRQHGASDAREQFSAINARSPLRPYGDSSDTPDPDTTEILPDTQRE